jgi:hypothetical protein
MKSSDKILAHHSFAIKLSNCITMCKVYSLRKPLRVENGKKLMVIMIFEGTKKYASISIHQIIIFFSLIFDFFMTLIIY